jgi:hypothetical protein
MCYSRGASTTPNLISMTTTPGLLSQRGLNFLQPRYNELCPRSRLSLRMQPHEPDNIIPSDKNNSSSLVSTALGQCMAWQVGEFQRLIATHSLGTYQFSSTGARILCTRGYGKPQSSAWTLDRIYIGWADVLSTPGMRRPTAILISSRLGRNTSLISYTTTYILRNECNENRGTE